MAKMYPPCMMMNQRKPMKAQRKEHAVNFIDQYIEFQAFLKEMEKEKKDAEKKPDTIPGKWAWVETREPRKYTLMETLGMLLLLSVPIAVTESLMVHYAMRWIF